MTLRNSLVLAVSLLALSACASFSKDGGLSDVKTSTEPFMPQEVVWPKTADEKNSIAERVAELLTQPLDADCAVQIALLNNQGLQAAMYDLGIAEADLVQIGRLPNPRFSMLYAKNGGDYTIEQALTFNIISLFTMPKMQAIERQRFEQTKQRVAIEVLNLAYQTRQAYFEALAAKELVNYSLQVQDSAEASAELAKRMQKAGNWSALEQAREQSFYVDAVVEVASAKNKKIIADEALARLLGVSLSQITLEKRLPDLPKRTIDFAQFEKTAFEQRLDLKAMKLQTEALAKQLGLTKATRFINVLEIGPARVLEGARHAPFKTGVDISFELPLFDWGQARVARAEATYMQAVHRASQMVINAQSEIREAYGLYQSQYKIAQHYRNEIVPLRKKILSESQLRYNGMLIGPFELFADARGQVISVKSYIESLREFWLAENALQMTRIANTKNMEGKTSW